MRSYWLWFSVCILGDQHLVRAERRPHGLTDLARQLQRGEEIDVIHVEPHLTRPHRIVKLHVHPIRCGQLGEQAADVPAVMESGPGVGGLEVDLAGIQRARGHGPVQRRRRRHHFASWLPPAAPARTGFLDQDRGPRETPQPPWRVRFPAAARFPAARGRRPVAPSPLRGPSGTAYSAAPAGMPCRTGRAPPPDAAAPRSFTPSRKAERACFISFLETMQLTPPGTPLPHETGGAEEASSAAAKADTASVRRHQSHRENECCPPHLIVILTCFAQEGHTAIRTSYLRFNAEACYRNQP